jgi:hypothetical protein
VVSNSVSKIELTKDQPRLRSIATVTVC